MPDRAKTTHRPGSTQSSRPAAPLLILLGLAALVLALAPAGLEAKTSSKASAKAAYCPPYAAKGNIDWRARKHGKMPKRSRGFHLAARSALLLDFNTGAILYAQDPDRRIAPASITKVLTLYLLYEDLSRGKLATNRLVPVSARAGGTGGSSMGLARGDKVNVGEIINGISICSANDACVAIAESSPGGMPAFVKRMNQKARELGMTSSGFVNPSGLPASGQYSTARDIARLSVAYLKRFPQALTVHSQRTYTHDMYTGRNANSLLASYPGADGLKTGYVDASGYNITATAKRDGVRLVAVVLGCQSSRIRERETARLLDKGFAMTEAQRQKQQEPAKKKKSRRPG